MTKYNEIEIQTAKNLLENRFKWLARNKDGKLFAYSVKPSKGVTVWYPIGICDCICNYVPIFQSVRFSDKEPTSIESIVHPQILDDVERRYLSAVIRPFKDRVGCICKTFYTSEYQHIYIVLRDCNYNMYLPIFKKGTMYKGMEFGRSYSLEELGL